MAIKSPGFVQVTTATTGNGPYTLTNTVPSSSDYRSIANAVSDGSLANGDTVHYVIFQTGTPTGKMFERGWGTINTTTLVLTVTTVLERSAALTSGGGWGAGTKDVYFAPPGAESVALLESANIFNQTQSINGGSLDLINGGIIRGRLIYQSSVLYLQYYSSGFILQGALQIGNGTFEVNDGTTTKKIVRYVGGAAVKQTFNCVPPTFWTRINVTGERVAKYATVADTPETQAGSWAISGLTVSGQVDAYALAVADIPSHNHSLWAKGSSVQAGAGSAVTIPLFGTETTGNTGGGGTHTHTITNQPISSTGAWRPAYEIVVKASFD